MGGVAALGAMGKSFAKAEIEFKKDGGSGDSKTEQLFFNEQHALFMEGLERGGPESVIVAAYIVHAYENELVEIKKLQSALLRQANKSKDNTTLQAGVSVELISLGRRESELEDVVRQFKGIPEVSEFLITLKNRHKNTQS